MSKRPPDDVPLDRDASARVLPWVIAVMVYLAALAVAGAAGIHGALARWNADLAGKVTVQIDPGGGEVDRRLDLVLDVLRTTPGVAKAEALERDSLVGLLEPWLGRGNVVSDLPLPQLIDVDIDPRVVDLAELARRIESIGSGVHFDDHAVWTKELLVAARSIQALALMAAGLIGVAAVAIVVFATRAGFATHIEVVELLHLMGAQDRYIARQFQRHFRRLSLKGGIWGLLFGAVTLIGLGALATDLPGPLLPHFSLGWPGWAALMLLPPIASLVAMATARLTVMRALGRLP